MIIEVTKDGTAKWNFYRKSYRKARWRKVGQRCVNDFIRHDTHGLIIVH